MRLIDAENLLNRYEWIDWYSVSKEGQLRRGATTEDNPFIHYYDGKEIIKNSPTIDAVPVIRCRECEYHNKPQCPMKLSFNWTEDEDFCSYGERKEGAE